MSYADHIQAIMDITRERQERLQKQIRGASGPSGVLGHRWVFLGDSITEVSTQNENLYQAESFPLWVQLLSGGRIYMVRNAGNGGDTSAMMLARFDAEVSPFNPDVVFLLAGTNDVSQGVPLSTYQYNVDAIRVKCQQIGAVLALGTITGLSDVIQTATVASWNQWLRMYASKYALPLAETHAATVDRATGQQRSELTTDGTHQNSAGMKLLGKTVSDAMLPHVRPWAPPVLHSGINVPGTPLPTNPILSTDSDGNGIPDGWDAYGGTGVTHALVTHPDVPGNMMQATVPTGGGLRVFYRKLAPGSYDPGDRVLFAGFITNDGNGQTTLALDFAGNVTTTRATAARFVGAVELGFACMEVVIPEGATGADLVFIVQAEPSGVTASLAQPTVVNLTRLGLSSLL